MKPGRCLAFGALLLCVSACEEDGGPVLTPPPIALAITPAESMTIDVGERVQLDALVSGGAIDAPRTVTWSSSNPDIATVGPAGLVTAHAAGDVTITAMSDADGTVRAGVALTVATAQAESVTVTIVSIEYPGSFPIDFDNVSGFIDVGVRVSSTQGLESVELLIDDKPAVADLQAPGETQDSLISIFLVDTGIWRESVPDPVLPEYRNGPHVLRARATHTDGTKTVSVPEPLTFNNENFIFLRVQNRGPTHPGQPSPTSLARRGAEWYSGDFAYVVTPVNYGPADEAMASVTVMLTSTGPAVTGVNGCTSGNNALTNPTIAPLHRGTGDAPLPRCPSATAAQTIETGPLDWPHIALFPANKTMHEGGLLNVEAVLKPTVTSVTFAGTPGPTCLNPIPEHSLPRNGACGLPNQKVRMDNLAPRITQLSITRPPDQWWDPEGFRPIALGTADGAGGTTAADEECSAPCVRYVDYGVGVKEVQWFAGPPDALVRLQGFPAPLEESATANDYVFAARVFDHGNNRRRGFATPVVSSTRALPGSPDNLRFGWRIGN